ncbi:MAG: tetratricopeptide repeat protein [Sedimentisphaerales bacterium]
MKNENEVKTESVAQEHEEEFKICKKMAEQGSVDAQFKLFMMYNKGKGVAKDCTEAHKWLLKAIEPSKAKNKRLVETDIDIFRELE